MKVRLDASGMGHCSGLTIWGRGAGIADLSPTPSCHHWQHDMRQLPPYTPHLSGSHWDLRWEVLSDLSFMMLGGVPRSADGSQAAPERGVMPSELMGAKETTHRPLHVKREREPFALCLQLATGCDALTRTHCLMGKRKKMWN